jgi:GTP-binding protein EngB required for normal cell division
MAGRPFLLIDTPGFGHPDLPLSNVKEEIYDLLGYFTRRLGGVHGILYLHDIRKDRTTSGMKESFQFLEDLSKPVYPLVMFITTGWDLIVPKERARSEQRGRDLSGKFRRIFANLQSFEFGASWEDDTQTVKDNARAELENSLTQRYGNAQVVSLSMPFWQSSFGKWLSEIKIEVRAGVQTVNYYQRGNFNVAAPGFRF